MRRTFRRGDLELHSTVLQGVLPATLAGRERSLSGGQICKSAGSFGSAALRST